jgi:hypothetical protein
VQRFSISVDDELAAWIESEADERGVSKAKVIRDSVETARITGLVQSDEQDVANGGVLLDRVEALEERVTKLEGQSGETANENGDGSDDVVSAFEAQLEGQPPTTEHGQEAVTRVFSLLIEDGPMKTSKIRETLYPDFEDEFADPKSMWQSINRYFSDLDGIEKAGHGKWDANLSELGESEN